MRVLVTGATGLVGTHLRARLLGLKAHADFIGEACEIIVSCAGREDFADPVRLARRLDGVDAVVHLAAVNRPQAGESHAVNRELATTLVRACEAAGVAPYIVYTNSTQAIDGIGEYGSAKSEAADILRTWAEKQGTGFAELILPHVFGEAGRPDHNTVTSTLCANAVAGRKSNVHAGASVELVHADTVCLRIVDALNKRASIYERVRGCRVEVAELDRRILAFRDAYRGFHIPDLRDDFERDLFNTYRTHEYPARYPMQPVVHADSRGELFEAVKGGGGGQSFLSWTEQGVTRGNHYHLRKMERFMVVEGTAVVRVRPLFSAKVSEFHVSGAEPVAIDMPTMHPHSIENVGEDRLLTLFWAHEVFDPEDPDTYSMAVLGHADDLNAN